MTPSAFAAPPGDLLLAQEGVIVPFYEVVQVGVGGTVLTVLFLGLCLAVATGRAPWVERASDALGRRTGLPGWCALPLTVSLLGLVVGGFCTMWDVNWHLERGRDLGLLSQPSHAIGLAFGYLAFLGAALTLVLARRKTGPGALRFGPALWVPAGGAVAVAGMSGYLLAFPLDDVWHRMFGLDVAFWSPIHFVILTAGLTGLLGLLVLLFDGEAAVSPDRTPPARAHGFPKAMRVAILGFLTVFGPLLLDEWNLGLPQADLLFDPLVIALCVAPLVMGRLLLGRGGALLTWLAASVMGGAMVVFVGPLLGNTAPALPLLLGFAVAVEAAAWALGTRRAWRLAVMGGAAAGVVGALVEFAWARATRPLPWPAHLLPQIVLLSALVATGAAVGGVFVAQALLRRPGAASASSLAALGLAATAVLGPVAYLTGPTTIDATARITTTVAGDGPDRPVLVEVVFDPPGAVQDAKWLHVAAWQGGGVHAEPLTLGPDGVWRTANPVPTGGTWKTTVRANVGLGRSSVPVRLPADPQLNLPEIPLQHNVTRDLVSDVTLMQRERRTDVPQWMFTAGTVACTLVGVGLLSFFVWGLTRPVRDKGRTGRVGERFLRARV